MENLYDTTPKRRSKEYKKFLKEIAETYNTNGKPTVLMVCDTFFPVFDGVVNVLDNYCKNLKENVNVVVLAPSFRGRVYMKSYPVIGVPNLYSKALGYNIVLPGAARCYRKLLSTLRIDLIHCHSPFFLGRIALRMHKKRKIPMVTTFHSQYRRDFVKYVGDGLLTRFLMRFIMKVFCGSDELWTMQPAVGDVARSYGYEGKIRYLPNATVFEPSKDYESERRLAREKMGAGDEPLFLFVGRLVAQKNILFLAEVLGELKRRGLKFKMIFVGEGPDHAKLQKKLKEENVSEETVFMGHVSDISVLEELYAAADLFLFPSLYDTNSLVQVEAASRRTPTAFAEGSTTSCTVTDGVNGYILPCDKEGFADGVMRAISDREELEEMGRRAFRDLYVTWGGVVERAEQYYREIISAQK